MRARPAYRGAGVDVVYGCVKGKITCVCDCLFDLRGYVNWVNADVVSSSQLYSERYKSLFLRFRSFM